FKILSPEGFLARVTDGNWTVKEDAIPISFDAEAGHFYRVEVFAPDRSLVFDKKLEAKGGMAASLWVRAGVRSAVARVAPVAVASCLDPSELASIKSAIEDTSFADQKVDVLESAIGSRSICGDQ